MAELDQRGLALGFSGRLAQFFLHNTLTPLLAIAALLLGIFAVLVTPREEEPQIDVTFANIFVPFPGASSAQLETLVASPMEQVLGEIEGVKHIYSVSKPGIAVLTVQFEVGEKRNEAIVRLYNAIYSNQDWRPPGLGVLQPLVKPGGIDDVPILALTLWTRDVARGAWELGKVARSIETEIKRVPGTRDVEVIGSPDNVVHVELDAVRLSGHGLTVTEIAAALSSSNLVQQAGSLVSDGRTTPVQAGTFLAGRDAVAGLVVGVADGKPIYLEDVATIAAAPDQPESYVSFGAGAAWTGQGGPIAQSPAVTIAVSKKPGENASDVATEVLRRAELLRGTYIPDGIELTVTRNYGETANDKAQKLIQKLLFATASVVLLVILTMGSREALVVGTAVIVTLAATLFASWAWGFTINRVSLFALIFSIGILVDDAIVIVENIHRHNQLGRSTLADIIPRAVDEVGGPTILATFTVIAALLPMAFVSGLMGPYMSPIPINSSMGMLISLVIALVFTPWMCRKLLAHGHADQAQKGATDATPSRMTQLFERTVRPFLAGPGGRTRRHKLYWAILAAIAIAVGLAVVKLVVMKMLPFDNKSEFQIVLNMPEGTPVEATARVLDELASVIETVPEVTDYQVYAGTAAPINFNGLVRQYYLRQSPEFGDIQVNLLNKHDRDRQSHDIALDVRAQLAAIGARYNASVQVVEVPPGPPVQAPIVAEVYGSRYAEQQQFARQLRTVFDTTVDIVDVDDSLESTVPRLVVTVDQQKAALLGVSQTQVTEVLATALSGRDVTFIHSGREREPIPVRLELPVASKSQIEDLLQLKLRAQSGAAIPIGEVVTVQESTWDAAIYHKDLLPVVYVTGDMAGPLDSPLYGMFDMVGQLDQLPVTQHFIAPPDDPNELAVKWDGEWQITYETFRDMGLAYAVGLVLIYLLVVAQFGSYFVPLIIMAPIPLTIIGVMPGHALLGAQFTATSMIGMIALAGIIVRNSILLVDFINMEIAAGSTLEDAVVKAGAVRAKPIVLTALAAMIGAFFILDDPIFNGLAVALIFGIFVSTLLPLIVIPILYCAYLIRRPPPVAAT
ncbi:MAG: efflux RND transporter permease subunit [Proteobacteria bacterium]|nr:efflux RND transporter permease subunit [Pseudomonadota bacterium]